MESFYNTPIIFSTQFQSISIPLIDSKLGKHRDYAVLRYERNLMKYLENSFIFLYNK